MRYRRTQIEGATYFFTVVTEDRRPIFAEAAAIAIFKLVQAEVQKRHPFVIDAEVILPDHIHALWSLPDGDARFSMRWRLIKSGFTRTYLKDHVIPMSNLSRRAKREQGLWQRRYWEHLIRDDADYIAHADYIHYNPVRHGLVTGARDWPHSTFTAWVARGVYEGHWGSDQMPALPDWAGRE